MKFKRALIAAAVTAIGIASSAMAQEKTLRLLTWALKAAGFGGDARKIGSKVKQLLIPKVQKRD